MSRVLTAKERQALDKLSDEHRSFLIKGQFPRGIGEGTLEALVRLGLAETGSSERYQGQTGWRITPDGWRCMYGKTYEEIMAQPAGVQSYPLRVWRWPPEDSQSEI